MACSGAIGDRTTRAMPSARRAVRGYREAVSFLPFLWAYRTLGDHNTVELAGARRTVTVYREAVSFLPRSRVRSRAPLLRSISTMSPGPHL